MSPLAKDGKNEAAALQPRDSELSAKGLSHSIPVSVKDDEEVEDEDYFVVEGDSEENINKALAR